MRDIDRQAFIKVAELLSLQDRQLTKLSIEFSMDDVARIQCEEIINSSNAGTTVAVRQFELQEIGEPEMMIYPHRKLSELVGDKW